MVLGWACTRKSSAETASSSPSSVQAEYICEAILESPPANDSGRVVWARQQEVERLLKKHGCKINGRTFAAAAERLDGFFFGYTKEGTEGDIHVFSTACPDNRWQVLIFVHESGEVRPHRPLSNKEDTSPRWAPFRVDPVPPHNTM